VNRRLYRSVADRKIGGVAAGTAAYFDIDPSISRVLWLLLAIFTGGAFLIVYLVMWAVVPDEPWEPGAVGAATATASLTAPEAGGDRATGTDEQAADQADEPAGSPATAPADASSTWSKSVEVSGGPGPHVIFGVILILIGGWFLAQQFLPWLNFGMLWPIGLVVVGVIILAAALRRGG
jgi:phage shock protein PspC (stress-responsive transcriptional regulator)